MKNGYTLLTTANKCRAAVLSRTNFQLAKLKLACPIKFDHRLTLLGAVFTVSFSHFEVTNSPRWPLSFRINTREVISEVKWDHHWSHQFHWWPHACWYGTKAFNEENLLTYKCQWFDWLTLLSHWWCHDHISLRNLQLYDPFNRTVRLVVNHVKRLYYYGWVEYSLFETVSEVLVIVRKKRGRRSWKALRDNHNANHYVT